jgi:hypothetical protein
MKQMNRALEASAPLTLTILEAGIEVIVRNSEEASNIYLDYIDANLIGGQEAPHCLLFLNDKQVGFVSYNGRVWKGISWPEATVMYEPKARVRG